MRFMLPLVCSLPLLLVACGGPGPRVTLVLEDDGETDLDALGAVRVNLRLVNKSAPEVFEPFLLGEEIEELDSEAMAGEPFYVDVWGCAAETPCLTGDVLARGCTDVLTLSEDADDVWAVTLKSFDPETAACPPAPLTEEGASEGEADALTPTVTLGVDASRL